MNYNKLTFSPLLENTLLRFTSEFNSEVSPSRIKSELSKALKRKVSSDPVSAYNINIKRNDDGTYIIESSFMLLRDSRSSIIDLFKWIERNGETTKSHNLFIDIKFIDSIEGPFKGTLFNRGVTIEKIDKLKMILDFDESVIYKAFPNRENGYISKSISRFEINQRFIPNGESPINPKFYTIPDTSESGINFETLNQGFLRLQYIGGIDYEKQASVVLDIINNFCISAWDCTMNPGYTPEHIRVFEKSIKRNALIRESYLDYQLFKRNFPKIILTIDLVDNKTTVSTYYMSIRDQIFDFISNAEFKGEVEINYDTTLRILQVRGAKLKCDKVNNIEFVNCEITYGTLTSCDLYDTPITDAILNSCNIYLESVLNRCKLINSYSNRTTTLNDCEIEGDNGVLNGDMNGGIFRNGSIGKHAKVSSSTNVIEYRQLKTGYFVAGDKVIIPTKKYIKP